VRDWNGKKKERNCSDMDGNEKDLIRNVGYHRCLISKIENLT
jgi:hypothetical protein